MIEWVRGADWPQVALILGALAAVVVALVLVPESTLSTVLEAVGVAGLLTGAARRRGLKKEPSSGEKPAGSDGGGS